ncbi:glycosyltransferase involved in cell wall biosynthesis [Agrobacterium vitis]|nr:glycosyltransferase involved in cell wall biosynthesis [Agrobacterium vitis]MBE1436550.1 glycosyltransferase involved in cell wall biosynthesis [Agrobacterium vitis]
MQNPPVASTIMIDGFNLGMPHGTGVATYARNLSYECHNLGFNTEILYGLQRARRNRSKLVTEVSFFDSEMPESPAARKIKTALRFFPRPGGYRPFDVPMSGEVVTRPLRARLPYFDTIRNVSDLYGSAEYQYAITGQFQKVRNPGGAKVMHWTYPLPLRLQGARNIYTLHDLVPLRLPYTTLDRKGAYLKLVKQCVREGDRIATVSEASRADIIRMLDCPPENVVNTYQSVSFPEHLLTMQDDEVRAKVEGIFGLQYKKYFMFFGAIEPKKNVGSIIEAFLSSGLDGQLAIVGPTGWKSEQELRFFNAISETGKKAATGGESPQQKLFRFEFVPLALLVALIKGAKATVFPSLSEGFGLPVLESMLLGTPVITSNIGATAEVAGDAALLVDPYDTRDIAAAIQKLDGDAALRETLSARGRERADYFSPERYRERLRSLYTGLMDLP